MSLEIGFIWDRCCLIFVMVLLFVFGISWIIKFFVVRMVLLGFMSIFMFIDEGICLDDIR